MKLDTNQRIIKYFFIAYCIVVTAHYMLTIKDCFNHFSDKAYFEGWFLSEWLINYSDGFVRRGLWGEGLLYLKNNFNIDIAQSIIWIVIVSTTALILFTIYFFKKKGLSFFLLPNIILLGSFAMNNILSHRRDALMLLIIFFTLCLYKKWIDCKDRGWMYYILLSLSGIIVILTHEASFFCFVPFITFDYFVRNKNKLFVKRVASTTFFILPMLITMGCACIFKGNEEVANNIWNSYAPYFQEKFAEMPPLGEGVKALTWTTELAVMHHIEKNFMQMLFNGHVPSLFAWVLIFFFAFYLMTNVNKIKIFGYEKDSIDNKHLACSIAAV